MDELSLLEIEAAYDDFFRAVEDMVGPEDVTVVLMKAVGLIRYFPDMLAALSEDEE